LNRNATPHHIINNVNHLFADDRIVFNVSGVAGEGKPFIEHYTYGLLADGNKSTNAAVHCL